MSKFKLKSKSSSNKKKTHFEYKCKPTFIFFPRISSSGLYHLNESGFLLVGP
jgi:hypothetical protein